LDEDSRDLELVALADFEKQRHFLYFGPLYSHPGRDDVRGHLQENGLGNSEYEWFVDHWLAEHIIMGNDFYRRRAQSQSDKDAKYVTYAAGARSQFQTGDNNEETIPALGDGDGAEPVRGGVRR